MRAWTGNLGVPSNSTGWARAKRVHQESPEEGEGKEQSGKQEMGTQGGWVKGEKPEWSQPLGRRSRTVVAGR